MNGTTVPEEPSSPIILLLGPPGVGKSTLGRRTGTGAPVQGSGLN